MSEWYQTQPMWIVYRTLMFAISILTEYNFIDGRSHTRADCFHLAVGLFQIKHFTTCSNTCVRWHHSFPHKASEKLHLFKCDICFLLIRYVSSVHVLLSSGFCHSIICFFGFLFAFISDRCFLRVPLPGWGCCSHERARIGCPEKYQRQKNGSEK